MIRLLAPSDYCPMPWGNGGGGTAGVAVAPPGPVWTGWGVGAGAQVAAAGAQAAYGLASPDWNPGVIGIVASRLAERHHRPVLMIALDGDRGTGSGRSIPGFDLLAGLVGTTVEEVMTIPGLADLALQHEPTQVELELDVADWDRVIAADLTSAFLVGREAARRMIPRRRGKIINICSVQTDLARPTIAPYVAAKGGLRNLTRAMTAEWPLAALSRSPFRLTFGAERPLLKRQVIAERAFFLLTFLTDWPEWLHPAWAVAGSYADPENPGVRMLGIKLGSDDKLFRLDASESAVCSIE